MVVFSKPLTQCIYYHRPGFTLLTRVSFYNTNANANLGTNNNSKLLCCNAFKVGYSHFNHNNYQHPIYVISQRQFNKNLNAFHNWKRNSFADTFEAFMIFIPFAILCWLIYDFEWIWNALPRFITQPIESVFFGVTSTVGDGFRQLSKWMRKADSLAKENINQTTTGNTENEVSESNVLDGSLLSSMLYYLNIKRDQESKEGGFRNKKIIEYENRIRLYSNPDKIFRYFASIKIIYGNGDSEIYMTPDDFLRALTPGIKQPDGLGLDKYKRIDLSKDKNEFKFGLNTDSIFYKLSKYGLINFSDFLFLLTVISVSKRHFEIAFRMFDLNNDGDVEYEEFAKVQNAILAQTSIGQKMGKSVHYKGVSSAVSRYFFGENLNQRLTIENFLNFQSLLQNELLTLEFERKTLNSSGKIREIDFAELLVAYAALSEKKRNRIIKRVAKRFGQENYEGISIQEYLNLFRFLQNINDVDIALALYHIAGASIDQATLKHVASTVAHVELSDHLVSVVFTIFDENEDGQLSYKEFISVMKERLRRGLSKPKDTGFLKIMYTIWKSLISFNF